MSFTDLITGLAFVNMHIGFYRLDKGLRGSIDVPLDKLQAHVQLLSRSAEAVTIANQIQQLKGQADEFRKQQLNAEHAQLMVQVGQLQLQLEQLKVGKKRLELEVEKEKRLAQENQILRIFVDIYDQAQTYKQQKQFLDYIVVVFAAFRIYRQIYSDLDDANNRLRVSDLKEKLFQGLYEILETPKNRQKLVDSYTTALQKPVALLEKGQHASNDAVTAIDQVSKLRQAPQQGDWLQSIEAADSCITSLETAKSNLIALHTEYTAFTEGLDLREFFFPVYTENINEFVSGMLEAWTEWINSVETNIGNTLLQLYMSLEKYPPLFERQEKEAGIAIEEAEQLRITHQLGNSASFLIQTTPVYSTRFKELNHHFKELTIPKSGSDPTQILDVYLTLQQLKTAVSVEFSSFQEYLKANKQASDQRYLSLASERLKEINITQDTISVSRIADAFELQLDITKLESEIEKALKTCKNLLDKTVESDDLFQDIQQYVREILGETEVKEIESLTASHDPSTVEQALSVLQSDKKKEANRRRRLLSNLVEVYVTTHPLPAARWVNTTDAPTFPTLAPRNKKSLSKPITSMRSSKSGRKKPAKQLIIIGGLISLIILVCCTFFLIANSTLPKQTETPSIQANEVAESSNPPVSTDAPKAAAIPTAESTASPTFTPQPTATPQPTHTPNPTDTPTSTPTKTPTSTNTPSPTPFSKEDYIASASAELDYREVNRSDRHIGEIICWKGEVFNINESQGITGFQAYYFEGRHVTDRDNAFVVIYDGILPDVYEETEVFICGEVDEEFTGTNAFGAEISQPRINAKFVDLWEPAPLPTAPPTNTPIPPTPLPIVDDFGVQKQVGQWGMKLYDVKRAKTVYFFGDPKTAQGVWLIPFVEFTNNSTGTRSPYGDLDFYLQREDGVTLEIGYDDGTAGAAWQFQAGDLFGDIQPGSLIGVALAVDVPENTGNVWLKVEQDPNFAIYLGDASTIPLE